MGNSPFLTIGVAVYNLEKLIKSTLDSLLLFVHLDLEIILVNDGSKDETLKIINSHSIVNNKNVRVLTIINSGHGGVINKIIDLANGKYLRILDGDDFFNYDFFTFFSTSFNISLENNVDLFLENYTTLNSKDNSLKKIDNFNRNLDSSRIHSIESILDKVNLFLAGYMIKTSIFKENHIRITEKIPYDDNEFVCYPLKYIKNIFLVNTYSYVYRVFQINQSISLNSKIKNINAIKIISDNLLRFSIVLSPIKKSYVLNVAFQHLNVYYEILTNYFNLSLSQVYLMRKELKTYYNNFNFIFKKAPIFSIYLYNKYHLFKVFLKKIIFKNKFKVNT